MSIKNLFGKKSLNTTNITNVSTLEGEIESLEFIEEDLKDKKRFVPNIDFETPSNFARYGSAEKYYTDSIRAVYKTYPYDGSFKEKLQWHNKSSDLTNYIFENVYPRKNGYINVGFDYGSTSTTSQGYDDTDKVEYIYIKGTLNDYQAEQSTKKAFEYANKYDVANNRAYNLNINGIDGVTVEFYFKKDNLSGSSKQVIFDLWNSSSVGSADYGRFRIEVRPGIVGKEDRFFLEISSGSNGIAELEIGSGLDFIDSWHHYAVAFINSGSSLKTQLFVDGDMYAEQVTGSSIGQVYGPMIAQIGSLITTVSGSSAQRGWGKLSGSLDEFRYWKVKRTDKEISRNFFTNIGAGANTDNSNTSLGLYYKFNEGVYSNSSISNFDKTVLDYSGRIGNGTWQGYSLGARNTGSAIVLSEAAEEEFADPLVYPDHPEIIAKIDEYSALGKEYDQENIASMYKSLPEWIADEDSENGESIKNLMQIMSGFFDDLHIKLEYVPKLKNIEYTDGKPLPFSSRLLENVGFEIVDIFNDSTVLEMLLNRSETENYDEKISNVKNFVYQNIYNNILYIYKSKGTEKAFRNLIRCFGIDDELVKLNLYADNVEFTFEDRFNYKTIKKKYLDFNNVDRFDSTVVQRQDSGNPDSLGYIPGSNNLKSLGATVEAEVIFPNKFSQGEPFFFATDFVSCSLFGLHESANGTWASPDRASVQVFAVRDFEESKNVSFLVSSSYFGINVQSELFKDTYANQKWNFALRLKHEKYPYHDFLSGSDAGNYVLELYGVNTVQDIKQESFLITASVDASLAGNFFSSNKMLYVGAHRENFSGSVVTGPGVNNEQFSDAKISSVRYWHSYVKDEIIDLHAKDAENFGAESPVSNVEPFLADFLSGKHIYQADTLALHWDFLSVSSSDNGTGISNLDDGEFLVQDSSSGSLSLINKNAIAPYTKYQFTGKGIQFPRNSADVVQNEFVYSAKRRLPEVLNNSDLVQILEEDDEYFTRDTRPVNHYFAAEKSMYQVISSDMINWIGTITNFSNLVGNPLYRYEESYRDLDNLRQLYFSNVQNNPDFERFAEFYKWIDDSISRMIEQLIPASMNYTSGISNVIESHVLERNKYRHKLPTIEFKGEPPLGPAKSINELLYNWKTGHAPISGLQSDNCDWWFLRAERTGSLNSDRQGIFSVATSALNRKFSTVYNLNSNLSPVFFDKKRETEIIRNEVGFDISGNDYFEITDLLAISKDCDD